jgi:GAF domain-containing protein
MSDGGDGFGELISDLMGAEAQTVPTVDAAHRVRLARWWWVPRTQTAIIESAVNTVIVALQGQALFLTSLDHAVQRDVSSSIIVPIMRAGLAIGVVNLNRNTAKPPFDPTQLELAATVVATFSAMFDAVRQQAGGHAGSERQ